MGQFSVVKFRGTPVYVRHRTAKEIEKAQSLDISTLRDTTTIQAGKDLGPGSADDAQRCNSDKPNWLVVYGVCTHLGCVPIAGAGDYGGWCVFSTLGQPLAVCVCALW